MSLRPDQAESEEAAKEAALKMLERGPRTEREIVDRLLVGEESRHHVHLVAVDIVIMSTAHL